MGRLAWIRVIAQSRRVIFKLVREAIALGTARTRSTFAPLGDRSALKWMGGSGIATAAAIRLCEGEV